METRDFLGFSFAALTEAETLALLETWAGKRDEPCRQVATVNVEFVTRAWHLSGRARSEEFVRVIHESDLVVADGMPIVWLSRLLGQSLPERVPGSDLLPDVCERATAAGPTVYFLGGRDDDAERAAAILRDRNPSLRVVGIDNAFVSLEASDEARKTDEEVLSRIAAADPDILFVGFGAKKQDIWIARHKHRLSARVAIGIGGSYRFVSGENRRAPVWMQHLGLEWVHRICQEPRRLLWRYTRDIFLFWALALRQLLRLPFRA